MTVASWADSVWRRGLRPDPTLTVSEWADRHRMLSQRAAAEPGPWRTERTPYLREIMDALSVSSPIERVVFMKGAQIGGTEAGNNWLGYVIAHAPGPAMAVSPTTELAKRASKQRIDPMIEETPALRRLVAPAKSRDSGNTVLSKDFPGGVLVMTGANSAVGLRSMPVRFLFLDEVDAYPADADGEGDPVALAIKRTATFARRKILMVSTPTVTGVSRIEAAFEESDQRRFFVPCPHCGEFQTLTWNRVKWSDYGIPPEEAVYECAACEQPIENHQKGGMLAAGEWRATAPGDGRTAGFHLSALYSPPGWFSWGEAARDFTECGRNPSRLKTFVNTTLGETFREAEAAPDWRRLFDRCEDWAEGTVPAGGLVLTAGVDVQKDRLEVEVVAWGRNRESWSIDYRVLYGSPQQPAVWRELDALLAHSFPHAAGGNLSILRLAIDTGYATPEVYAWCAKQPADRVMAIKGVDGATAAIGAPTYVDLNQHGRRIRRGARLWPVGTSILKGQLYGWLSLLSPLDGEATPDGLCHFPKGRGEEYFRQLAAEQLIRRQIKGSAPRLSWEKTRDRNEALDCRIYAMAAAEAARIPRFTEAEWRAAEIMAGVGRADESPADPPRWREKPASVRSPIRSKFMAR